MFTARPFGASSDARRAEAIEHVNRGRATIVVTLGDEEA
jgi:hypothetical protein